MEDVSKLSPTTMFDAEGIIDRDMDEPHIKRDNKHVQFMVIEKDGRPSVQAQYNITALAFVRPSILTVVTSSVFAECIRARFQSLIMALSLVLVRPPFCLIRRRVVLIAIHR